MPEPAYNRRTHAVAWVLACAVFPLIWMGGLVTTYEAGMAVPDWPNTYGYNLFLYPLASWLKVWDLFLEHSHRLIGSTVGMIAIVLAVLLWRTDRRRWIRWLGVAAVAGIASQGVLGGLRVLGDSPFLAMVHGCTAPLVFGLAASLVTFTSRPWQQGELPRPDPAARLLRPATLVLACGLYVQIVLGAQLRHQRVSGGAGWFPVWVWLHLIVAGLVLLGILWLLVYAPRRLPEGSRIVRRARLLGTLFLVQLLAGAATWVTNYGFPAWFQDTFWVVNYTVVQEGWLQALTTTAHVALGSLNLVAGLSLVLWTRGERLRQVDVLPASSFRAAGERGPSGP